MPRIPPDLLTDPFVEHGALRAYLYLVMLADQGEPFPPQRVIATTLGMALNSVESYLRQLRAGGYLEVLRTTATAPATYRFPKDDVAGQVLVALPPLPNGTGRYGQLFDDDFWPAYPKKVGKQAALKAWCRLKPTEQVVGHILHAIEDQRLAARVRHPVEAGFVPDPATWLNAGRWKDDPAVYAVYDPATGARTGRAYPAAPEPTIETNHRRKAEELSADPYAYLNWGKE